MKWSVFALKADSPRLPSHRKQVHVIGNILVLSDCAFAHLPHMGTLLNVLIALD